MARILIVEDDRDIGEVLCSVLVDAGHHCDIAVEGNAAVRLLVEATPDLVISDALLPGGTGDRVIEAAAEGNVPLLLMTGSLDKMAEFEERRIPCLKKPFRLAELVAAANALLGAGPGTASRSDGQTDPPEQPES